MFRFAADAANAETDAVGKKPLGVLGLAAIIRPLPVAASALESMGWLLGIVFLTSAFFWSRSVLSRVEGGVLVALNAINWLVDFLT